MRQQILGALLALAMVTCSSEDDDDDDDSGWAPYPAGGLTGSGGVAPDVVATGGDATGGDLNAPAAVCTTHTLSSAEAAAKPRAAFCFGMAYTETFSCSHNDGTDTTTCTASLSRYVVPWRGADSSAVSNPQDGMVLGTVTLQPEGTAALTWVDGKSGNCRIDSATLELCTVGP